MQRIGQESRVQKVRKTLQALNPADKDKDQL